MKICYKKLWKMLIDRDMSKAELSKLAGISSTSMAKLGKGENVTTAVLLKICEALKCDIGEIMTTQCDHDTGSVAAESNTKVQ